MPHRGSGLFALAVALCALSARADDDLPSFVPSVRPAAAEAPAEADPPAKGDAAKDPPKDKLTDLMKRVSDLEGAAKKDKEAKEKAAKKPTAAWSAQLQLDAIQDGQDAVNRAAVGAAPDGVAFRRARFGVVGEYGLVDYQIAMDFALPGRPSFIDVYAGVGGVPVLGHLRAGHFFEPFGFEQYSRNRFLTFLERSLPSEPIAPGRNTGVMAFDTYAGGRGTWAVGVFHTDTDVFGDDTGNDFRDAVTGRATYLPWYDEATDGRDLLHVGLGYSARATKGGQVRFAVRPEVRLGSANPNVPNFADTGPVGAGFYQLVGAEGLWVRGPFSVQGEYALVPVDTYASGAVYFQSWYAFGSVFLTGEHRRYRRENGTLDRIFPRRDFVGRDAKSFGCGPGAVELALRVSHLDLNNGGVRGGRLTDVTVGLNWYLNPYLRVTANYIHAFQTTRAGRDGSADFYGLRLGFDF